MNTLEFFREACETLRQGGTIEPVALGQIRAQLVNRQQQIRQRLESLDLPPAFLFAAESLEKSLQGYQEALNGLQLAVEDDCPELADWISLKAQESDEILRGIEQKIVEHSEILSSESPDGNW